MALTSSENISKVQITWTRKPTGPNGRAQFFLKNRHQDLLSFTYVVCHKVSIQDINTNLNGNIFGYLISKEMIIIYNHNLCHQIPYFPYPINAPHLILTAATFQNSL